MVFCFLAPKAEEEASVMQIGLSPARVWQPEGLSVALGNRAVRRKKNSRFKIWPALTEGEV